MQDSAALEKVVIQYERGGKAENMRIVKNGPQRPEKSKLEDGLEHTIHTHLQGERTLL